MTSPSSSAVLQYNLYQDQAYSLLWGTGNSAESLTYSAAHFGAGQKAYVYGRVPARQNVPAGNFADAPAVAISF